MTLLGVKPEEWKADPELWKKMMHPDDRDRVVEEDRVAGLEGSRYSSEYRMIATDGRVVWFRDDAAYFDDPVSGLSFWQGMMLDITEQMELLEHRTEAEAKYRALVEQLPAVVYLGEYGEEGDWLYISPRIEHVLGYTPEEWLAHPSPMGSFTHPDDLQAVWAAEEESRRTGQPFRADYRMRAKDGRWVWILDEASAVRDGDKPLFMQGVMYDVTERKRQEQDLAEALEQLRALDSLKNTLLHTLSHDLKEPLTAILGAASTLERLEHELPEEERKHLLQTLIVRTKGMNTLLTDLLDLDRLDQGIIDPRRFPVDLGELARDLVAKTDVLHDRSVEIDADQVIANIDGAKVERMLENMLANAARHTPVESHIWLRVARADGGALLIVEDDGPGVSEDQRDLIFEPFRRGPSVMQGSGIGLSLVARFAELHAGRAWVEDRPGGGASFRVFLPDAPVSS